MERWAEWERGLGRGGARVTALEEAPVEAGSEDAPRQVLMARLRRSLCSVAEPSVLGFPLSWPWAESPRQ